MGSEDPATAPQQTQETDNGNLNNIQAKGRTPYRLYVGGLNYSTTTDTLRRAFEEFGAVLDGTEVIYDRSSNSKGFGFVNFVEEEAMKKAIEKMNGHELDGRKIQVMLAQPEMKKFGPAGYMGPRPHFGYPGHPGANRGFRVSIQGVHPTVTWRDLKDFLRQAGEVRFADVVGPGLGMGEFATAADRVNAIRMLNGKELKGSKLSMKEMTEMGRFGGGGGGGGGFPPRGPFMGDHFYGNFDMPYGAGFDHGYGYGMGGMEFGSMGFPPPPRMPAWGARGGARGGYGMGSYPPGSGYGRGNGRMDGRWTYGGFGRPTMGRGYERAQFKGYDGAGDGGRPYDYERMSEGYARASQVAGEQVAGYGDRMQGDRAYAGYKERYPEGYSGTGGYAGSREEWSMRMYRSNPDVQYTKYESGQNQGFERGESDTRAGYSSYRPAADEQGRDYNEYSRNNVEEDRTPRNYSRSAYGGYVTGNTTSYAKQANAAAEQGYEYEKSGPRTGTEDYTKYRNEDVYARTERNADGYSTQERREYDYSNTRTDTRTYSGSGGGGGGGGAGVDYKARETDYYADRRGDYANSRTYREEDLPRGDPRGIGGAERHRNRTHHRTSGPYER